MRLSIAQLKNATEFFENDVLPWWQKEVCERLPKDFGVHVVTLSIPVLLAGIFLQLKSLLEATQQGSNFWRITPYVLLANAAPTRIVDIETSGMVREVAVWVDGASGGVFPILRISDGATGSGAGGLSAVPGNVNELGKVPANKSLYIASDTAVNVYVIERG